MNHRFMLCTGMLLLAFASGQVIAQTIPAGLWKTFDDDTGKAKSLVRIVDNRGLLEGRIEKLLDPDDPVDGRCDLCLDERRNQRILGLLILRDLRQTDGKPGQWEGGDILDPENGKLYRVRANLSPDGRHLDVRGYIGVSFIGRTQRWLRID
jgi:uncharacterized protein (DUF2147 family)